MSEVTTRFETTGMHCGSCAMLVRMNVEELAGVGSVAVDAATGIADVTYDGDLLEPGQIVDAITRAGYGAKVAE